MFDRVGNAYVTDSFQATISPANVAFNGRGSALVANHAVFTGIVENFAVLDVFVNDRGSPLELPRIR